MLDSYGVSLPWSGGILALTQVTGGAWGLGIGYFVFVTGKRNSLLVILGLLMAGTYIEMTLTGSPPLLVVLALVNGSAWGYWPALATVPYQLPGIRPREVAVANTFMLTMSSAGFVLGPLIAGFLEDALGDLRLTLAIVSFSALLLTWTGLFLRPPQYRRVP
jgi:MFS family permease